MPVKNQQAEKSAAPASDKPRDGSAPLKRKPAAPKADL
jgi:hypothetical protein